MYLFLYEECYFLLFNFHILNKYRSLVERFSDLSVYFKECLLSFEYQGIKLRKLEKRKGKSNSVF